MQTLQPGAELATIRHHTRDVAWFIHKGQGRVFLDGRTVTIVPGMLVTMPRGTWHGLRNTGTGLLQILWMSTPAGLEAWWREMSSHHAPLDEATLQSLAKRYDVEPALGGPAPALPAQPPTAHTAPREGRGRGRRRHRRSRRSSAPTGVPPTQPVLTSVPQSLSEAHRIEPISKSPQRLPPATTLHGETASALPQQGPVRESAAPSAPQARPITRRGSPSWRASEATRASPSRPPKAGPPGAGQTVAKPSSPSRRSSPARHAFPHSHGHVKEIYMGGRWIRVEHEGPVIAPGRSYPPKRQ